MLLGVTIELIIAIGLVGRVKVKFKSNKKRLGKSSGGILLYLKKKFGRQIFQNFTDHEVESREKCIFYIRLWDF